MSDKQRILVAEANRAVGAALRKYLESAGFVAEAVEGFDDALNRLRNWAPDLLMCGVIGLDGQTLCRKAKELSPGLPVVLVYPPDDEDPEARAATSTVRSPDTSAMRSLMLVTSRRSICENAKPPPARHAPRW